MLWNGSPQSPAPARTDALIQLRCDGTCSRIQGDKMDATGCRAAPEHSLSQREQALNPWTPYRSYSPWDLNNPWGSTSKASSHQPGSPRHGPFPSHSTTAESSFSACDASGQTPGFIFRSMGFRPMGFRPMGFCLTGPRHQNFPTFPGHTTSHPREFHGPDSTLTCAGHLQEAPNPSQKPQQPRGPRSTSTSCRDTQGSCWDKLAQQSPSVSVSRELGGITPSTGSAVAPWPDTVAVPQPHRAGCGAHMAARGRRPCPTGASAWEFGICTQSPQQPPQGSSSGSGGWLRGGQQPHRDSFPARLPCNRQGFGLLCTAPVGTSPTGLAGCILHRSCYRSQIVLGPFFGAS